MVVEAAGERLLDIGSRFTLGEVVMVDAAIEALGIALWMSYEVAFVEGVGSLEFVAKAVVGHVDGTEDETTAVYLYAHLLTEGTSHEEAVKIAAGMFLVGERGEVHVLEGVALYALVGEEQGL